VAYSYFWLGRFLYLSEKQDNHQLALQSLDKTIEIETEIFGPAYEDLIVFYYWRARISRRRGQDPETLKAYQKVGDLA
jgi:hypothetical protein